MNSKVEEARRYISNTKDILKKKPRKKMGITKIKNISEWQVIPIIMVY